MTKPFLVVTALAELSAGIALLGVPRLVFQILLAQSQPSAEASFMGRVAGAALLALGVACGLARSDPGSPSLRGLLCGMLAYNIGVAALLGYAGWLLGMSGMLLWPTVAFHTGLALCCLTCLRDLLGSK